MRASVSVLPLSGPVRTATLTTMHSSSSYGLPVLLDDGEPIGPAELLGILVIHDPVLAGRAEAAGYPVALDFDEARQLLDTQR